MRVVLIASSYYPEINGGSSNLHQRLEFLSKWGHHVLLVAPKYGVLPLYADSYQKHSGDVLENVRVVHFPSEGFPFLPFSTTPKPFTFNEMSKTIEDFKPDVIQVESPERLYWGFLQIVGVDIAKKLAIPVTCVHHTNYAGFVDTYNKKIPINKLFPGLSAYIKNMTAFVYNKFDAAVVNSNVSSAYLTSYGVNTLVKVSFLGVDPGLFNVKKNVEVPVALSKLDKNRVKILYVGRMSLEKALPTLEEAFKIVDKKIPGRVALVMVGGGEEDIEARFKKMATERPDTVAFVGRVPLEETVTYYNCCDIFVTPSPCETTGLTVMEAMSCGIAVVGPNQDGIGETIKNGVDGLSYNPAHPQELANHLEDLALNPKKREKLRDAALESAKNFSLEAGTRKMVKLWEDLTSLKKSGKSPSLLSNDFDVRFTPAVPIDHTQRRIKLIVLSVVLLLANLFFLGDRFLLRGLSYGVIGLCSYFLLFPEKLRAISFMILPLMFRILAVIALSLVKFKNTLTGK